MGQNDERMKTHVSNFSVVLDQSIREGVESPSFPEGKDAKK